jgi:hypothetical protein
MDKQQGNSFRIAISSMLYEAFKIKEPGTRAEAEAPAHSSPHISVVAFDDENVHQWKCQCRAFVR